MLVINIYYTGKDGSARKFAEEMTESGTVELVRKEEGNFGYTYFSQRTTLRTCFLWISGKIARRLIGTTSRR